MPKFFSYLTVTSLLLCPYPIFAQTPPNGGLLPDRTLGPDASTISPDTINGMKIDRIDKGAIRGTNLFHSFQQFNINAGSNVYFANPNGIANIITRVTGNNPSQIFGTLGVLGNANLFLLNPKGIVFGPQAKLDLRGSFLATTADSIIFDNRLPFSASNPDIPLLNVNIPIGLGFRENSGTIVNQSQAISQLDLPIPPNSLLPISPNFGLLVPPGQTLGLIGGNVQNSGNLTAFQGNILIGSVASPGFVGFNLTPTGVGLDYSQISNFGPIEFTGSSLVNASGLGGGEISLTGGNISISNQAALVSFSFGDLPGRGINIQSNNLQMSDRSLLATTNLGNALGGNINISAKETINLTGISFSELLENQDYRSFVAGQGRPFDKLRSTIAAGTSGAGNSGQINLKANQVNLRQGFLLQASTIGAGNGGDITVQGTEGIDLNLSAFGSVIFRQGNGGRVTLEAKNINMEASIISNGNFGSGTGGDIVINATESLVIAKRPTELQNLLDAGLLTTTQTGTGNAGNIIINAPTVRLAEGSSIFASTGSAVETQEIILSGGLGGNITINAPESLTVEGFYVAFDGKIGRTTLATGTTNNFKAGDININTGRLVIGDGAVIGSGTLGAGDGGDININATDAIEISGNQLTKSRESIAGISASSGDPLFQSINPFLNPTGNAGNINITTNYLSIRDGTNIAVASFGPGEAGNANIQARTIELDEQGFINGNTVSGSGANLNIQAEQIIMRHRSRISTDAGLSDGGNINLRSNILVAFPLENNDITANARSAVGGKITVNIPNIFGAQPINRAELQTNLGLTDAEFAALDVNPTFLLDSSDIAAISQATGAAFQGTVVFSSAGINPSEGLINLDTDVTDPANLIALDFCRLVASSEFTVTGKGGIAINPNDLLADQGTEFIWIQPTSAAYSLVPMMDQTLPPSKPKSIIPAQGWVITPQGNVTLVAQAKNGQNNLHLWYPIGKCRSR